MINQQKIMYLTTYACAIGLLLGILMAFITKSYLNRSKRRQRYIELIWGTENQWHSGEKFDFFMANYVISSSPFTAWWMKSGFFTKKLKSKGSYLFPMLHREYNYLKLLDEFPFFVRWEFTKAILLLISVTLMVVIAGDDKGWW